MGQVRSGIAVRDVALAATVVGLCEVQVAAGGLAGPTWVGVVGGIALGGAVLLAGTYTWAALIAVFVTTVTTNWLGLSQHGPYGNMLAGVVVVYALASRASGRQTLAGLAFGLVMVYWAAHQYGIWNYALAWLVLGGAALAGRAIRNRRNLIELLQDTTDQLRSTMTELEATREDNARAAVASERARIAREMHDVIAHAVSVIVIQAGAAEEMLDLDPSRAREPLRSVQNSARQALGELRRLLTVVRPDADTGAGLAPQPGLADLDTLAGDVRAAGVVIAVHRDGAPIVLPPGVDLAAYRIVQEALTNVLKHANARTADVAIRYRTNAVELEVTDDGGPSARAPATTGHGLVGMRERAALYGGRLEAGCRSNGGYAVKVLLPVLSDR